MWQLKKMMNQWKKWGSCSRAEDLGPKSSSCSTAWMGIPIYNHVYIYIYIHLILYDFIWYTEKKNGENMSSSYSRSPKNHQILCKCSLKLMKMEEKSRCQWSYATSTRNCRCLDIVSETQTPFLGDSSCFPVSERNHFGDFQVAFMCPNQI